MADFLVSNRTETRPRRATLRAIASRQPATQMTHDPHDYDVCELLSLMTMISANYLSRMTMISANYLYH